MLLHNSVLKKCLTRSINKNRRAPKVTRRYTTTEVVEETKISPISLTGIYVSIPTPFNANSELALNDLEFNIEKYSDMPLSGLLALGPSGEFSSLSFKEKVEVLNTVKKSAHAKMQLLAGTSSNGIKETIELTKLSQELGFDAAMVVPPFHYAGKLTDATLESYFLKIADDVEIPLLLCNTPTYSGITFSTALVKKLAQHPNIVGIVDSSSIEQLSSYVTETKGTDFNVLGGSNVLLSLISGAKGVVTDVANILPEELNKIFELYQSKEFEEAETLQREIAQMSLALGPKLGTSGLKYIMNKIGFQSGPTRLPCIPLNEHEKLVLDSLIQHYKL